MEATDGDFQFLDPGDLSDGVVRLRLVDRRPADLPKGWVPCYVFDICSADTDERVGEIQLRIGDTDHMRLYGGHIGYVVHPKYRGRRFAARALRLILRLAASHGLSELWITCNPDNIASRRTCEAAGAEFIDIVDLPPDIDMYQRGERQKCRYRLSLSEYTKA
jgi:tagatose 1,6-diphosphate aldolase